MRHEVVDVGRPDACVAHGAVHRHGGAAARRLGGRDVIRVRGQGSTDDFGQNRRPACLGVGCRLDDHDGRTLAERARPDGLTFYWGAWDPLAQALKNPSLRVRYEQLAYLGGIGDVRILYARSDTVVGGIKRPRDIMQARRVIVGATSSTDWTGLLSVQAIDVLGLEQKVISGYRGGTDLFLALQRGEVQVHNTSIASYNTRVIQLIKSGSLAALAYLVPVKADGSFARNTDLPDVPAFPDLYHEVHGKPPSGVAWDALNWLGEQTGDMAYVGFLPPGMPPDITKTLRDAFVAAASDHQFVAQSTKQNGVPYQMVDVDRGNAIIEALAKVSPEILSNLRQKMDQIGR